VIMRTSIGRLNFHARVKVDLHVPLLSGPESPTLSEVDESKLNGIRRYISESRAAASSLEIPDDVAEHIQSEFVRLRKEAGDDSKAVGEEDLKRWMRIGR
jgi:DNA replicative helicase MCM subunit Mcm2 (Cdc46/Mcm family)